MLRLAKALLIISAAYVSSTSLLAIHAQGPANTKHPQPREIHVDHVTVIHVGNQPEEKYSWGAIHWLMGTKLDPGALQTFGIVRIDAGKTNALHLHPNCEEIMYVLSGTGTTTIDGKTVSLQPGDLVRIPVGVLHQATASKSAPLVAAISYSSGDRQTVIPGAAHE